MITYHETTLANGLRVATIRDDSSSIVDVQLWFRAGYRAENPEESGYSHFLEHMLLKGSNKHPTPFELALQVDRRGAFLNAFTSSEYNAFVLQAARRHADAMTALLAEMMFESLLAPDTMENERGAILQETTERREAHDDYVTRLAQKRAFAGHPLGRTILDTEEATKTATPDGLRKFLERVYSPERAFLIFGGGITHEQAMDLTQKYFSTWKPRQQSPPSSAPTAGSPETYGERREIKQTFLSFNFRVPGINDPTAVAATTILANLLGYGQTSLLKEELRTKRGLVYGSRIQLRTFSDAGLFSIETSTVQPKEVIATVRDIIAHLPDTLTPALFDAIREETTSVYERKIANSSFRLSDLGTDYVLRNRMVTPDAWLTQLRQLTHKQITEFIGNYLSLSNMGLTYVGPETLE